MNSDQYLLNECNACHLQLEPLTAQGDKLSSAAMNIESCDKVNLAGNSHL